MYGYILFVVRRGRGRVLLAATELNVLYGIRIGYLQLQPCRWSLTMPMDCMNE